MPPFLLRRKINHLASTLPGIRHQACSSAAREGEEFEEEEDEDGSRPVAYQPSPVESRRVAGPLRVVTSLPRQVDQDKPTKILDTSYRSHNVTIINTIDAHATRYPKHANVPSNPTISVQLSVRPCRAQS